MSVAYYLLIGFAAAICSALAVLLLLGYARRRLLDAPGQHRSHSLPTPRGGGLGVVLGMLGFGLVPILLWGTAPEVAMAGPWLAAGVLIAVLGWFDDHYSLPIAARLLGQLAAAAVVVGSTMVAMLPLVSVQLADLSVVQWGFMGLALLALMWSINLHNFMDGANGLLLLQSLFVSAALLVVGPFARQDDFGVLCAAALFGATLGLLPFNFPRAQIFSGDVGSTFIGLMIGALLLRALARGELSLPVVLILVSAFLIDASATLLLRMARGRRWYTRHREHLYQWLIRRGSSHPRVVLQYAAWNLLLALPVAWVAQRSAVVAAWLSFVLVYLAGGALWYFQKRRLLGELRPV